MLGDRTSSRPSGRLRPTKELERFYAALPPEVRGKQPPMPKNLTEPAEQTPLPGAPKKEQQPAPDPPSDGKPTPRGSNNDGDISGSRGRPHSASAKDISDQVKRSRCCACCRSCCGPFCSLFIVGFVGFPIALFMISAFFALPLWAIECGVISEEELKATIAADPTTDACNFYEWFKYIMGNLVALATPLTNVNPVSGHVAAELVDLLICSWSMGLTGVSIGIISGLSAVSLFTKKTDSSLSAMVAAGEENLRELAKDGLDFDEFTAELHKHSVYIDVEKAREYFDEADKDGSQVLNPEEAEHLIKKLKTVMPETPRTSISAQQYEQLAAQLAALQAGMAELTTLVKESNAHASRKDEPIEQPVGTPPAPSRTEHASPKPVLLGRH